MNTGEPLGAREAGRCKAILARHAAFVQKYAARFSRLYRVDPSGVRALGDTGTLARIAEARAAFSTTSLLASFEATLPVRALPRMSQAPVETLRLLVVEGRADAPPRTEQGWSELAMPVPVAFEPFGELRARAFEEAPHHIIWPPPSLSYRADEPLQLETIGYEDDGLRVSTTTETLYEPQLRFGDLELGYLYTGSRSLAIRRGGALVDVVELHDEPMRMLRRGADLHILSRSEGYDEAGPNASWSALIVHPDGTSDTWFGETIRWWKVETFHSPSFDRFGVRGQADTGTGQRWEERTWRWDGHAYVLSTKHGPDRPPPVP
jgi:hypothetical protein